MFRYTDFRSAFTRTFHKGRGGIAWGDVLTPYVASLATGKSDFEALRPWFGQAWVAKALRIDRVASPETLRQHLDNLADGHLEEALVRHPCNFLNLSIFSSTTWHGAWSTCPGSGTNGS